MWFKLGNRNTASFKDIEKFYNVVTYSDDMGHETYIIEINTLEDLMSLGAVCHANLEFYSGVLLNGDTLTVTQEGDKEWR